MKTTHFFILGVLLLVLGSCSDSLGWYDLNPSYTTMCSYCSDNYQKGDTVLFVRNEIATDTFVVKKWQQVLRYTNSIQIPNGEKGSGRYYAGSSVSFYHIHSSFRLDLDCVLCDHSSPFHITFQMQYNPYSDEDEKSQCFGAGYKGELPQQVTEKYMGGNHPENKMYFVVSQGVGLVEFNDKYGNVWKLYQEK